MGNGLSNTPSHNYSRRWTIINNAQSPFELHKRQTKSNYLRHWTLFTNLHLGRHSWSRAAKWYNNVARRITWTCKLPISERNSTRCLGEVQKNMSFENSCGWRLIAMAMTLYCGCKNIMICKISRAISKFLISGLSQPCDKSLRIRQSIFETT